MFKRRIFSLKSFGSKNTNRSNATRPRKSSSLSTASVDSDVPSSETYRVVIPENVTPGEHFQVNFGNRVVRIHCPLTSRPGDSIWINIPNDPTKDDIGDSEVAIPEDLPPQDSENVTRVPEKDLGPGEEAAYLVRIPDGVQGGLHFPVVISGQRRMVTCPIGATSGMNVRVVLPREDKDSSNQQSDVDANNDPSERVNTHLNPTNNENGCKNQTFEVILPNGVKPGRPFTILAGESRVRVLVTCPPDALPGQKIRFRLPAEVIAFDSIQKSKLAEIKLSYDKDGWTRTIRVSDMKFQWMRVSENGNVDTSASFDVHRSAYVLKLDMQDDVDDDDFKNQRGGTCTLVTAEKGVVDSRLKSPDGSRVVAYSDIVYGQVQNYADKIDWFHDKLSKIRIPWSDGHIRINIRRENLLHDSIEAIMAVSRTDLRKIWRVEFVGEEGIDAGGLAREWFHLVTDEMFDPDLGLWQTSASNQMCMQINPLSGLCCPDHLASFRALGRLMGKAVFDRQLIKGHMVKYIYKHILRWPIMFNDLKDIDEEYFNSLKCLVDMGPDIKHIGVDFTETEEKFGVRECIELIPNGKNIDVTERNLPEYLEACLKYRVLGRYELQLRELLLGFSDIIPQQLLTVFDFQELELLMCGLPNIDVEDWQQHTEYSGEFDGLGPFHDVCTWFWEIVSEYDDEMKARLLQFTTGTSGVPVRGFSVLQGNDGNVRKFTIHGVTLDACAYPRSHTCFNRIDLPLYKNKSDLEEKLKIAITMAATGFDIE